MDAHLLLPKVLGCAGFIIITINVIYKVLHSTLVYFTFLSIKTHPLSDEK